ncbi:MAG: Asp-tRNA(Asn)/Glu-tRNA(Gln) amidotransferase subunit GatC [Holophagales bacterium]|jgi:aspartyl-tRNA(Asn)/glutamyl-tRNA(Gln) amidotransferase subunit C|nr:Asp-tRNA(Asn)/Glu-tRNA(Gln) amidotransferase subunit GatC [Holophagales bacterium]
MLVTREDVLHCARLAALSLEESEIEPLRKDMEQLLSFAKRLDELDLGGSEPVMHTVEPRLRRREDVAVPGLTQSEALANAPEQDRGCFVVPKIL